jgi:hypothetical protein
MPEPLLITLSCLVDSERNAQYTSREPHLDQDLFLPRERSTRSTLEFLCHARKVPSGTLKDLDSVYAAGSK